VRGYEYIAKAWIALGVKDIFLVPTNLYDSLVALEGRGVRRILTHGEKAAAYMADGYAQAAGKPGVVVTQGGPGATNLAAGLADAFQGSVPVIAFTEPIPGELTHKNKYQFVEYNFGKVTKFDAEVLLTSRLPELLAQAWREATAGDPRPVHLAISPDAEAGEADLPEPQFQQRYLSYPAVRIEPEERAIDEAVELIGSAERPVMVAGGGAMKSSAWPEVQELAERLQIPVATSLGGKGAIAADHPLAIGVVGTYSHRCANDLVSRADLVLAVGTRTGGQSTNKWSVPPRNTQLIHVTIDPREPGRNYPNTVPVVADAKVALRRIIDRASPRPDNGWAAEARNAVREWRRAKEPFLSSSAVPIRPERVCAEIGRTLPADGVIVADTGYAGAWAGVHIDLSPAGKRFIRCEGSLGWALPGAIGVQAALPGRTVVALMGDGGFWYHVSELETAVRYGLNVVFVVLDNSVLAFDTHILDFDFDSKAYEIAAYTNVNLAAVAQAIGCRAERITSPEEIAPALLRAYDSHTPTVLDVVVDPDAVGPVTNWDRLKSTDRAIRDSLGNVVGVRPLAQKVAGGS
jgi:acetolactate synthase-1/2/3 large subunit